MIEGIYTFRDNGEIVGRSKNLLTTAGKTAILNYLSKYSTSFADYIAVGTGTVAATTADAALGFEFDREKINLVSADYTTTGVVLKSILPVQVVGTIYEAGLWLATAAGSQYSSKLLSSFEATDGWSAGTQNADATKIGGAALRVSATASTTTTTTSSGTIFDLSGYTTADNFLLSYNVNAAFVSTLKFRFKVDVSNYYEISLTSGNVTSGVHIVSLNKTGFTATGTPSWANIQVLEVALTATAGGTAIVDLDGIRMEPINISPDPVLVSRSVLATPIAKTNIRPMELEYRLRVTL